MKRKLLFGIFIICFVFPLVVNAAYFNPITSSTPQAMVTDGIFTITDLKPQKRNPGYIFTHPLDGDTAYWFNRNGQIVKTMELPGNALVLKQDDSSVYGIIGGKPRDFDKYGMNKIDSITLLKNVREQFPSREGYNTHFHHDILKTTKDTYMALIGLSVDSEYITLGKEKNIYADYIIEFNLNGDILWSWDVSKSLFGRTDGALHLAYPWDENWTHVNSIDMYPDGDVLVSVRNTNEIVRVDYPSGKILWKRGDEALSLQHSAFIQDDESVIVFNNGVKDRKSAVVWFDPNGNIKLNQDLDFFSPVYSSVERLPNGNWLATDGNGGNIYEYSPNFSEKVFGLKLNRVNYITFFKNRPNPQDNSFYRAYYVESLPY